jgi:dihydropyrimidinase
MDDLRIINGLVYQSNEFVPTNIYIKDGIITAITDQLYEARKTIDCNGDLVFPGIIDPHTHFALDLGHITSKDDFYHGTKAAAYGGVTTVIDFLEPVQTASAMKEAFLRRKEQTKDSVISVKFHACLKDPKDIPSIVHTMNELDLNTVKIFTTYSDSNRRTYDPEIKELLRQSNKHDFMVTAHIENDDMIVLDKNASYQELPLSRPSLSETSEVLKLAEYVKETNGYLYMVHCSSGNTIHALKEQYPDLLHTHIIVESCPHYVVFDNSVLNQDNGYLYTMAPPLRSKNERQLLIDHIDDIYTIGTDHCTFSSQDKKHEKLIDMPLGIGGVEESFRVLYTMFGDKIIDKMTINVAKAHKLYPQKGVLQVGSDADLFVYRKQPSKITLGHGLCDYTVYDNMPVNGDIITTIVGGTIVIHNQQFVSSHHTLLHK